MVKTVVGLFLFAILAAIAFGAILAYPIMLLWNGCLVGAVDGVKEIGYLQAWGIFILSNLIFKSSASKKE